MKKNAIRFLTVAFAFAALSLPALAQAAPGATGAGEAGGKGHHGMPSVDERVQHLTKKLNLSDDQQAKVKSILENQQSQATSLRQDTSISQPDRRAKFMQIHQATQQSIRDVLNDDQKAKFDQMQERRQEHMGKQAGQDTAAPSDKQ